MTTTLDTARYAPKLTEAAIARPALRFIKEAKVALTERFADYAADCAADRAEGHTAHYCIHGTNLWTDYDNICGGCEDGLTSYEDFLPLAYDEAIAKARRFRAELLEIARMDTWTRTHGLESSFDFDKALNILADRYGF